MNADELDQILARGALSGAQYDRIERELMTRVEPRRWPQPRLRAVGVSLAAASALAAAWLIALRQPEPGARFATKGEVVDAAGSGLIDVACGERGNAVCHPGDVLFFSVNSALVSGYVGAYAESIGPTPTRIWYFPQTDGHSPNVPAGHGTQVLREGIQIGAEHPAGRYRVTVWLSERPIVRGVDVADARGRSSFELLIR